MYIKLSLKGIKIYVLNFLLQLNMIKEQSDQGIHCLPFQHCRLYISLGG